MFITMVDLATEIWNERDPYHRVNNSSNTNKVLDMSSTLIRKFIYEMLLCQTLNQGILSMKMTVINLLPSLFHWALNASLPM